jgi:hypothetical protein
MKPEVRRTINLEEHHPGLVHENDFWLGRFGCVDVLEIESPRIHAVSQTFDSDLKARIHLNRCLVIRDYEAAEKSCGDI